MVAVEQFVGPPAIAEELVEPVTVVEEPVESVAVLEQLAEPVAAVEEPVTPAVTIEEPIEPEPIAEPVAVAPVPAAEAPSEPLFSVEDIDLEFWIADEPAAAPVEATVVPSGQVEDDRFYIAAQDFSDLDMSTLLDGLVLPEAATAAAPAPGAPTATASMEPERTAEPAPVPARTKLPSKRHVPVHDRAPEPNAARRRRTTPVQDEWGLFDPEQCGFAALIAKLDAVTDDEEAGKRRGTQTRVVSYN
jgi:hypothetical protein